MAPALEAARARISPGSRRSPAKSNLYVGAAFDGSRLNKLYHQDLGHDQIVAALTPLIERYARERFKTSRG